MNFINSDNVNHKSLRVRTDIGDKFLNVNLDQTYESLDILSLKIFQKDIYRLFDADYGIIVGRVLGRGVGIPNCRISVFISSEEETIANPTRLDDIKKIEAAAIYPFQTVYDKDGNGKIYNLLPKYRRFRGFNGFPENDLGIGVTPKSPVGTFPEKEEIITNETLAYVFDKYYKYSTTTNESGDYILVVPSNKTYTVNMSCDVTDIGVFSTSPAILKSEGYPDIFFTEDGGSMNPDIPLEELPNIDIQNKTITVKPLWSQNINNTNVGINRLDFNLIKSVKPFVTVISNYFTMNPNHYWQGNRNPIPNFSDENAGLTNGFSGDDSGDFTPTNELANDSQIRLHVKGDFDLRVFTIKNTVSDMDAEILNNYENTTFNSIYDKYDYDNDIAILDNSKYTVFKENGNLVVLLPCDRNKIITNEFGDIISVNDDNELGLFTAFRGYFWFDTTNYQPAPDIKTIKLKVPQLYGYNENATTNPIRRPWIWKHFKFDFGEIYGITQYNETRGVALALNDEKTNIQTNILNFGYTPKSFISNQNDYKPNSNIFFPEYLNFYNHIKAGRSPFNTTFGDNFLYYQFSLKSQWMNFSLYFINFGTGTYLSSDSYVYYGVQAVPLRSKPNSQVSDGIGAKIKRNSDIGLNNSTDIVFLLANGQTIKTNFFKVNKEDLLFLYDYKLNATIINATGGTDTVEVTQLGVKIPNNKLKGNYPRKDNIEQPYDYPSARGDLANYDDGTLSGRLFYLNQDNGDDVRERYFLLGQYNTNTTNESLAGSNKNHIIKYLFDKIKIF